MKNSTLTKLFLLLTVSTSFAQQEKGIIGNTNWLNNWTEFRPKEKEYNDSNTILFGNITSNTVLYKKNIYLLQGNVFVINNAVLTIEPGTIIKGDSESNGTLVITKGATIIADGKETDPIVFTSNKSVKKAGDWGGVILLGDAPINKFGGSATLPFDLDPTRTLYGGINSQSNSGIMRFVRIEFAGKKVKGFKEFNSLTLAGVGTKTVLDNIMCSFSGDDSFEIYGGEVNISKGVSYKALDDDFDFTQGAQVNLDNSLTVRNSYVSTAGARCLEIDSYERKEDADFSKKMTTIIASNITMLNDSNKLAEDIAGGLIKDAVRIAENSSLTLKKSVISGFNPAIVLDNKIALTDANFKKIRLEDIFFNNCKGNVFTESNANNEEIEDYYGNVAFGNTFNPDGANKETFIDIANAKQPDFRLKIAKITASNSK
jgi:hypothetical protein